ncbi:MAG: hypothetical protein K2I10_03280 [Lachnospiraceae bacterium]|nr:hypothetical protein [Lachnospiraceae bacterium]
MLRRTGNTADRAEKGEVKRARYIIVIQSGVCYNFSVIDNDKLNFMEKENKNADCTYTKFWRELSGSDPYV